MAWGNARLGLLAAIGLLLTAGCAQTSHVDDTLTTASLAQSKKAVAVMRVGSASAACVNVAVLLGVRADAGFRRHQGINVMKVRSLTEPAVAEVELDPGEYHVVAYRCQTQTKLHTVSDTDGGELYRTSYASFRLEAGEVVNLGYLHFEAWRRGRNAIGRPLEVEIEVTDWPLADLERFKAKRPHIYAQMRTRLMTVTSREPGPPTGQECARLKALQAEGKVQKLPSECAAPAPAARRTPAAVAKTGGSL
jgi:hypothetical protein